MTAWVLVVVPLLLVNFGYVVLSAPRIAATSWDSDARLWGFVLGTEDGPRRAVAVVQLLILAIPAIGVTFTFSRICGRFSVGAWRWSRGSDSRRGSVVLGGVAAVALLAPAWWPDARLSPYREGEPGTVRQGIADLAAAGSGEPLLRGPERTQKPLPAVAEGTSAVTGRAARPGARRFAPPPATPESGSEREPRPGGADSPRQTETDDGGTAAAAEDNAGTDGTGEAAGEEEPTSPLPAPSVSPTPSSPSPSSPSPSADAP